MQYYHYFNSQLFGFCFCDLFLWDKVWTWFVDSAGLKLTETCLTGSATLLRVCATPSNSHVNLFKKKTTCIRAALQLLYSKSFCESHCHFATWKVTPTVSACLPSSIYTPFRKRRKIIDIVHTDSSIIKVRDSVLVIKHCDQSNFRRNGCILFSNAQITLHHRGKLPPEFKERTETEATEKCLLLLAHGGSTILFSCTVQDHLLSCDTAHSRMVPPALMINLKNAPQPCLEANLLAAFSHLRVFHHIYI